MRNSAPSDASKPIYAQVDCHLKPRFSLIYKYIKVIIRGMNKLIIFNMLAVNVTNKTMIALTKPFPIIGQRKNSFIFWI